MIYSKRYIFSLLFLSLLNRNVSRKVLPIFHKTLPIYPKGNRVVVSTSLILFILAFMHMLFMMIPIHNKYIRSNDEKKNGRLVPDGKEN